MHINIIEMIGIITALQLILLSLIIIFHKKGKKICNRILAVFLFFNAFSIIEFLLYRFKEYLYQDYPYIFNICSLFIFLWGPLLYFYTKSLTRHGFSFKKMDFFHLIPFFIFSVYMMVDFHIKTADVKRQLLASEEVMGVWEKIIINSALHIQILIYLILSLLIIRIYRRRIKEYYSSISSIKLSWLHFIITGFFIIWVIDLLYFLLWRTAYSHLGEILNFISLIVTFIFAIVIVYKGLNYYEIFSGFEEKQIEKKYAKSRLSTSDKKNYLKKLISFLESEKPYLIPSLTIAELADKLSISSRHLSQVINELLNQNFFDFINGYRINEAKSIFKNPSSKKKTILDILFEVGFNSKASFNRAFKKHTGLSPTDFRKKNSF
jgi:AraC-like DNA-binding protein